MSQLEKHQQKKLNYGSDADIKHEIELDVDTGEKGESLALRNESDSPKKQIILDDDDDYSDDYEDV